MLGNNSDGIENRNGTASALLHIDESASLSRLAKQKTKKRRRPDSRQYQTGEGTNVARHSEFSDKTLIYIHGGHKEWHLATRPHVLLCINLKIRFQSSLIVMNDLCR